MDRVKPPKDATNVQFLEYFGVHYVFQQYMAAARKDKKNQAEVQKLENEMTALKKRFVV